MDFGALHPISVHFPVVLFCVAFILDLGSYIFNNKRVFTVANWFVITATLFLIPTIVTGLIASGKFEVGNKNIVLHQSLAFLTFAAGALNSLLRLFIIYNFPVLSKKYTVIFSALTFFLVILTGDIGGYITHGTSPFYAEKGTSLVENYYELNSPQARNYNSEQLDKYLEGQVNLLDVIPIFQNRRCYQCHSEVSNTGVPTPEFSNWLKRDATGKPIDLEKSPFYVTVIKLNRMPYDNEKNPIGLPWSERSTLLEWLLNGAPTEIPKIKEEPTDTEDEQDQDHSAEGNLSTPQTNPSPSK